MQTTMIRIGSQEFNLDPAYDVENLKSAIRTAQIAGGGFVDFDDARDCTFSAYISPSSEIVIGLCPQPVVAAEANVEDRLDIVFFDSWE
jgi:hypothetical protein